jgi:hypothetical protein
MKYDIKIIGTKFDVESSVVMIQYVIPKFFGIFGKMGYLNMNIDDLTEKNIIKAVEMEEMERIAEKAKNAEIKSKLISHNSENILIKNGL